MRFKRRIGQSSIELMVILVFILLVMMGVMYVIGLFSLDIQRGDEAAKVDNFARSLVAEFEILERAEPGYSRQLRIEEHFMERFNVTINETAGYIMLQNIEFDGPDSGRVYYYDIPRGFSVERNYDGGTLILTLRKLQVDDDGNRLILENIN